MPLFEDPSEQAAYEAAVTAAEQAVVAARIANTALYEDAFTKMFDATDSIRDWCEDTSAWIFSSGQYGAFDQGAFTVLMQQAETALLAYNAVPADIVDARLIKQQNALLGRGAQANALLTLIVAARP